MACNRAIEDHLRGASNMKASSQVFKQVVDTVASPKAKGGDKTSVATGSVNIELKRLLIDTEEAEGMNKVPSPKDSLDTDSRKRLTDRERRGSNEAPIARKTSSGRAPLKAAKSVLQLPTDSEVKKRIDRVVQGENIWDEPYKYSGFWQALVKHVAFHHLTNLIIFANVVWLAYDVDHNHWVTLSEAPLLFQVVENFFCIFFLVEIIARFMAMKTMRHAFHNAWFLFDGFLVVLTIWTTWIQSISCWSEASSNSILSVFIHTSASNIEVLRVLRLVRVCRMAEVARAMPELLVVYKAMFMAMRSGVSILIALVGIVYIFAILFTTSLHDNPLMESSFESVPQAMAFLLTMILCGHDGSFILKLWKTHIFYFILYVVFHFICTITCINILVGVLVGVVQVVADREKEEMYAADTYFKMGALLEDLDTDGNGIISKREFFDLMNKDAMIIALHEQNVDVSSLINLGTFLYRDFPEVTITDILALITQLRGTKLATVKDLVDLRKFMAMEVRAVLHAASSD